MSTVLEILSLLFGVREFTFKELDLFQGHSISQAYRSVLTICEHVFLFTYDYLSSLVSTFTVHCLDSITFILTESLS